MRVINGKGIMDNAGSNWAVIARTERKVNVKRLETLKRQKKRPLEPDEMINWNETLVGIYPSYAEAAFIRDKYVKKYLSSHVKIETTEAKPTTTKVYEYLKSLKDDKDNVNSKT